MEKTSSKSIRIPESSFVVQDTMKLFRSNIKIDVNQLAEWTLGVVKEFKPDCVMRHDYCGAKCEPGFIAKGQFDIYALQIDPTGLNSTQIGCDLPRCTELRPLVSDYVKRLLGYFDGCFGATLNRLYPETDIGLHQDFGGQWGYRIHIPIITNTNCSFVFSGVESHQPADGSTWLFNGQHTHTSHNRSSTESRYHMTFYLPPESWNHWKNHAAHSI